MIDLQSLPVSGGVIVAGALWAGVSAFVLGPLVVERSAEKLQWVPICEREITLEIAANQPVGDLKPEVSCDQALGFMSKDHRRFFNLFGLDQACRAVDQANAKKRELQALREKRLAQTAQRAGAQCTCAVDHLIEEKRWSVALHAGTGRLVTPSVMRDLNSSLVTSARAPHCARLTSQGGGE